MPGAVHNLEIVRLLDAIELRKNQVLLQAGREDDRVEIVDADPIAVTDSGVAAKDEGAGIAFDICARPL